MFETMAARAALPHGTLSFEIVFAESSLVNGLAGAGLALLVYALWSGRRRRRGRLARPHAPIIVTGGGAGEPTG